MNIGVLTRNPTSRLQITLAIGLAMLWTCAWLMVAMHLASHLSRVGSELRHEFGSHFNGGDFTPERIQARISELNQQVFHEYSDRENHQKSWHDCFDAAHNAGFNGAGPFTMPSEPDMWYWFMSPTWWGWKWGSLKGRLDTLNRQYTEAVAAIHFCNARITEANDQIARWDQLRVDPAYRAATIDALKQSPWTKAGIVLFHLPLFTLSLSIAVAAWLRVILLSGRFPALRLVTLTS